MKQPIYIFFLPAFILHMAAGRAQTDSSKVPIYENQTTEEKYDESYKEYIKQTGPEIRKLWKLNVVDMYTPILSLGFERKITKKSSWESYIKMGLPYRSGFYSPGIKWSLSQSFKYYYNLNRRERLGRKTNGFNANYLSLDIFAGEDRDPKPGYNNNILKDAGSWFGMGIRYGMQKRIGNFYFEPYLGLAYQYYVLNETTDNVPLFNFNGSGNPKRWHVQPIAGVNAGLAMESLFGHHGLFSSNYRFGSDSIRKLPVLLKTNLVDFRLLKPNLGWEMRVAGNLTSETFLKFGFDLKPAKFFEGSGFGPEYSVEMEVAQQFRYYYNFKRRATHGRNISGFSGNYLSLDLFASKMSMHYDLNIEHVNYHGRRLLDLYRYGLGIKYGIQRRIGSVGYVDLFTGAVMQVYEEPKDVIEHSFKINKTSSQKFLPVFGIRAGFMIGSGTKRDHTGNNPACPPMTRAMAGRLTESEGPVRVVSVLNPNKK